MIKLPTPTSTKNQQSIDRLRHMLELAEKGDLIEFSAVFTLSDGMTGHHYTGSSDLFRQLGMAEHLKHLIQQRICDGGES